MYPRAEIENKNRFYRTRNFYTYFTPTKTKLSGRESDPIFAKFDFDTGNLFFGAQCTRVECRLVEIENKNTFFRIRNFYALRTPYTHKNRTFEDRSGANIYHNRFLTVAIDFLGHNVPGWSMPGPKLKIKIDFTGVGIFTPTLHPQKPYFRGQKRIQYLPNFDSDTLN